MNLYWLINGNAGWHNLWQAAGDRIYEDQEVSQAVFNPQSTVLWKHCMLRANRSSRWSYRGQSRLEVSEINVCVRLVFSYWNLLSLLSTSSASILAALRNRGPEYRSWNKQEMEGFLFKAQETSEEMFASELHSLELVDIYCKCCILGLIFPQTMSSWHHFSWSPRHSHFLCWTVVTALFLAVKHFCWTWIRACWQ